MWIGEIVSRKWKDVGIRPDGQARIKIAALDTKGKYKRFAFVTKQTVDWLKQFRPILVNGNAKECIDYDSVVFNLFLEPRSLIISACKPTKLRGRVMQECGSELILPANVVGCVQL